MSSFLKILGIDKYTEKLKDWVRNEIDQKHADFVGSAPETLDTLNELATALGNDENFATTITNQLANKVDKVSGKGLSTNDFTLEDKTKLSGLSNYDDSLLKEQVEGNTAAISKINDIKVVPTKQKLGVLEAPLGGIGAVVSPKLEITDKFSNHLVYDCVPKFNKQIPVLKELILHTEPITFNIEGVTQKIKSSGIVLSNDKKLSYDTAMQIQIGRDYNEEILEYIKVDWRKNSGIITVAKYGYNDVYIDYDILEEMNNCIKSQNWYLVDVHTTGVNIDPEALDVLDYIMSGVFVYPEQVSTYIKSDAGVDLPIQKKLSDFSHLTESFPKEERILKHIELLGFPEYQAGFITLETIGGTKITIFYNYMLEGSAYYAIYRDQEEAVILDDAKLAELNDFLSSTTVYYTGYVHIAGNGDPQMLDEIFLPTFVTSENSPIELKTWSKIYTEQDALESTEIQSIIDQVFGWSSNNDYYYYYSDDGIGEFDLIPDSETGLVNFMSFGTNPEVFSKKLRVIKNVVLHPHYQRNFGYIELERESGDIITLYLGWAMINGTTSTYDVCAIAYSSSDIELLDDAKLEELNNILASETVVYSSFKNHAEGSVFDHISAEFPNADLYLAKLNSIPFSYFGDIPEDVALEERLVKNIRYMGDATTQQYGQIQFGIMNESGGEIYISSDNFAPDGPVGLFAWSYFGGWPSIGEDCYPLTNEDLKSLNEYLDNNAFYLFYSSDVQELDDTFIVDFPNVVISETEEVELIDPENNEISA